MSVSTFGEIPLDQETNAQVIAPGESNLHGCQSLEKPMNLKAQKFIWILKRGVCTYGKKAKNAQFSGALAVIVVHDNPKADIENLIPYADSHFHKLQTPILLIGQRDGAVIFDALGGYAQMIVSLSIEMEGQQAQELSTEFWMNPASTESYDLLALFGPVLSEFGDQVTFEPKYKFEDLRSKSHSKDFLRKHCYVKGQFCATHSENFESHSVLDEALRQLCLWKLDPDAKKLNFWKYIANYRKCLQIFQFDHRGDLDCYVTSYKQAALPLQVQQKVHRCVEDSFEDPQHKLTTHNDLLSSQKNPYIYSDIYLVPAFVINGELLKEELSDHSILRGLCDKLISAPRVCDRYFFGGRRVKTMHRLRRSMMYLFLVCVVATCLIALFILFWVRRTLNKRVDRELYNEINQHVTNYMKISS